ncbi:decapping endonuclease targeting mRNA [Pleurotus ostreatus]|uniref:Decapping nuclease n=1 Tax=Pleurotus ostreatus TaxID=5322 RepID=A0A8H6ZPQ0_PLEOS|nr:decapping endonuclease targeting mRNA [Pleurotus ostreatus]KAF7424472.1 decapping endonuclease targeting mRNA [Pleurotus ostreatus]
MSKRNLDETDAVEVEGQDKKRLKSPNPGLLATSPLQASQPVLELSYSVKDAKRSVNAVPFQLPTQLISFSYTPDRVLEFNDSAMRYFVDPPRGAQLSYGYDRWVRRPEERGRIDSLLKAWQKFGTEHPGALGEVGVVSWRGVMTKILTAPYEERDGWELNVMLVNGTMYFEEYLAEEKLQSKNDIEPRHRIQMYYGYSFESWCTSESPSPASHPGNPIQSTSDGHPPGWGGDVNTNVQWCSVVKTKLGNTRMVIGGEVDCVRGRYTGKPDNFVELKTSLTIRGASDEARFEKKLIKFYFQSFLLGVPEITVGFRTPSGVLSTVQRFRTIEIPRLVRGKPGAWDPALCLEWGDRFLRELRIAIDVPSVDPTPTPSLDSEKDGISSNLPVWRVSFSPKVGITVKQLDKAGVTDVEAGDEEERIGFLPKWYVKYALG